MGEIWKGAPVADALCASLTDRISALRAAGVEPALAILRAGERGDDIAYENGAVKRCEKLGIAVRRVRLPVGCTKEELLKAIRQVNGDDGIHGCLLLRPGKILQMDNPENPKIMEDLIRALGAEPVIYANRNECCGGYVTMEDPALARKKSSAVMENAAEMQADLLVTACPLCQYNLTKNTPEAGRLPVLYFTELLAEALGVKD